MSTISKVTNLSDLMHMIFRVDCRVKLFFWFFFAMFSFCVYIRMCFLWEGDIRYMCV